MKDYDSMSVSEKREYLNYLRTRLRTLQKEGRVLSAQNEADLKAAVEHGKQAVALIEGVLAQVGTLVNQDEMIEVDIKDLMEAINGAEAAL